MNRLLANLAVILLPFRNATNILVVQLFIETLSQIYPLFETVADRVKIESNNVKDMLDILCIQGRPRQGVYVVISLNVWVE